MEVVVRPLSVIGARCRDNATFSWTAKHPVHIKQVPASTPSSSDIDPTPFRWLTSQSSSSSRDGPAS